jgi:hypothetical protein
MTVSFVSENEDCPVCLMDRKIASLKLKVRFFVGFLNWSIDFLKIVIYNGLDKAERQSKIDSIYPKITDPKMSIEQIVFVLEDYCELRKGFTWN